MDIKDKDEFITQLLVLMNNEIEEHGLPIKQVSFDFQEGGEDMRAFLQKCDIEFPYGKIIYNSCISRGYIKRTIAYQDYEVKLTEEGQGRALSSQQENKDLYMPGNITIGSIQAGDGQIQIGHGNNLIIEAAIKSLVKEIEESDSTTEEKSVAKNKLKDFLNQPVVAGVLGAVAGSVISIL